MISPRGSHADREEQIEGANPRKALRVSFEPEVLQSGFGVKFLFGPGEF